MDDFRKELILDKLVKAALKRLFLKIPALGWGPIGYIVTFIVTKVAELIYDEMKLVMELKKIEFTNSKFQEEYARRTLKLKVFTENYGVNSPEYLEVKREAKEALADLVEFNVTS